MLSYNILYAEMRFFLVLLERYNNCIMFAFTVTN